VLLVEKREIEFVDQYVRPIAESWAPWWQLEVALARAELEGLDPEAAAQHYLRALQEALVRPAAAARLRARLSMAEQPQARIEQCARSTPSNRGAATCAACSPWSSRAPAIRARALLEELSARGPERRGAARVPGPGPFRRRGRVLADRRLLSRAGAPQLALASRVATQPMRSRKPSRMRSVIPHRTSLPRRTQASSAECRAPRLCGGDALTAQDSRAASTARPPLRC
jgi:hypothetical protein